MASLNNFLNNISHQKSADFYTALVPQFVYDGLSPSFKPRPYQQEAFGRFVYYYNELKPKNAPVQLLFHMATGSGKTLVMAGLILHLYNKGYRNFLFFVNSTSIIDKTKDNFLNHASSKYLFNNSISIGAKPVTVRQTANFQSTNKDEISIVFSTIQGLHANLNSPKENSITYEDFEDKKIVIISDEAHHINAGTKTGLVTGEDNINWEATAAKIVHANPENILLEFTATMDLSLTTIEKKYADKLLFDYALKQFRKDGYSKEVQVIQTDTPPFLRALQAVILSQYRQKIFEKNRLLIKPVLLFKSKTIKDSEAFFLEFIQGVQALDETIIMQLTAKPNALLQKAFDYFKANNISLQNLAIEIKNDFAEDKLISVNSKDESEHKQMAINSLEEETNPYRVVFAVDKLNEGWDVLNLFDIVRLYDTKAESKATVNKTTISEAQLIGRGARYCPFKINFEDELFTRKYDNETNNELRICEELYYHSAYNPAYIAELSTALETIGIKAAATEKTTYPKTKPRFKNPANAKENSIKNSFPPAIKKQIFEVHLLTAQSDVSSVFTTQETTATTFSKQQCYLSQFGEPVIRKAINQLPFYHFCNLKMTWPNLDSVSQFIKDEDFLGSVQLTLFGTNQQLETPTAQQKLQAAIQVLSLIEEKYKTLFL